MKLSKSAVNGNSITINIIINTVMCRAVTEIYAQRFLSDLEGTGTAASWWLILFLSDLSLLQSQPLQLNLRPPGSLGSYWQSSLMWELLVSGFPVTGFSPSIDTPCLDFPATWWLLRYLSDISICCMGFLQVLGDRSVSHHPAAPTTHPRTLSESQSHLVEAVCESYW